MMLSVDDVPECTFTPPCLEGYTLIIAVQLP